MADTNTCKLSALALTALLLGCGPGEPLLQGDRLTPRETLPGAETPVAEPAASMGAGAKPVPVAIPAARSFDWTHRAANPAHLPGNAAWSGGLTRIWSANAGQGDNRKNRINADPVVAGGRVFTLDSRDAVTATGTNGGAIWQVDLTPATDRSGDASGGGLAYGEGLLYATTGYGELVALNPATGAVAWRQNFEAAVSGAPTVAGGRVYVVARDGTGWAVGARDGKVAWQAPGSATQAAVAGGSAPAVAGDTVIFPFATGQLLAVAAGEGTVKWNAYVAGERLGRAYAAWSDLTGDPVVDGGLVIAGTSAGRLAAVDVETGAPRWSAPDGALGAVAVAGNALFLVNDEDQLLRLDAATGAEVWRVDMPYFTKERDKRRRAIHAHYGPVLAGGRLVTASSDGFLRVFDPASGRLVGSADLPGGAASSPVVSGGTLYVLSKSGQLHAFR